MIYYKFALVALVLVTLATGCKREDDLTTYDAPKAPAGAVSQGVAVSPPSAVPAGAEDATYQAPDAWRLDPTPHPMREKTFLVGTEEQGATVIITRFPQSSFTNDPLSNINRWRGQISLPPVEQLSLQPVQALTLPGGSGSCYDMSGPQGQRLMVAVVPHGTEIWFIKISGAAATIEAEKSRFQGFLESIRFTPEK